MQWLFKTYQKYQEFLAHSQCLHPAFYPLKPIKQYQCVVVDEAQDLSPLQLTTLSALNSEKQICFCEDSRQSLSDTKSKIPYLGELMHSWGKPNNRITLSSSYRCSEAVVNITNVVSQMKSLVTGNGEVDMKPAKHVSVGSVSWFGALSAGDISAIKQLAQQSDFALITLERYKDEASQLFGLSPDQVFSVGEKKGLESTNVVAYRLFDDPAFKEINKVIGSMTSSSSKNNNNRAKKDQCQDHYGPAFNSIFTAFTRAKENLYIYQPANMELSNIISRLKFALAPKQDIPKATESAELIEKGWFNKVKALLVQGQDAEAKSIYLQRLGKNELEFNAFKQEFLYVPPTPIIVPVSEPIPKQNNAIAVQKAVVPIKETKSQQKAKEWITNLLQTPSVANLEKLVNLEEKTRKKYLFDILLEDGNCLFTRLLDDEKSINNFINVLKQKSDVLNGITADVICKIHPAKTGVFANTSPLYWLSNEEILKNLLADNPSLVTSEALCLPRLSSSGDLANTSPLYWLSSQPGGREILNNLLEHNSNLVTSAALCLALPSSTGKRANTSPLYWLSAATLGRQILKNLLDVNPSIITSKALCTALPASLILNEHANKSPLSWLAASCDGREILKTLLTHNPSFITAEALCLVSPPSAGNQSNTSALYWLSATTEGQDIIKHQLAQDPNCITSEALCLARSLSTDKLAHTSALYLLSSTADGQDILKNLLAHNPSLITSEALCLALPPVAGNPTNTSPLYWLCCESKGRKILKNLLNHNPSIITSEALCLVLPILPTSDNYISSLCYLCDHGDGRELLKELLVKNPGMTISEEALNQRINNKSIREILSKITEGKAILELIAQRQKTAVVATGPSHSNGFDGFFSNKQSAQSNARDFKSPIQTKRV